MKTFVFIFIALTCALKVLVAQNEKPKYLDYKVGYCNYMLSEKFVENDRVHNFCFETDYNINEFIDAGACFSYGFYEAIKIVPSDHEGIFSGYSQGFKSTVGLGGIVNLHYLPLLTKRKNLRLDIYSVLRIGGNYKFTNEDALPERGAYFEYGVYAGAAYYFGKHLGAFFEYGFSNTYNIRYGLALKF